MLENLLRNPIKTAVKGLFLASMAFSSLYCNMDKQSNFTRNESLEPHIIVVGSNNVLEKNGRLNVKIDVDTNENVTDSTLLKAQYFLTNSNNKNLFENLIFIGERKFKAKEGIDGFFKYNPNLKTNYDPNSADINPGKGSFEFMVKIINGKDSTYKFWGEKIKEGFVNDSIKNDDLTFKFSEPLTNLDKEDTHQINSINKNENTQKNLYDKKDYYFVQKLTSTHLNKEIIPMATCGIFHIWDDNKYTYSEKTSKKIVSKWKDGGAQSLGMYSLFHKSEILDALKEPKKYANNIFSKVKKIDGLDGVVIDFESIHLNSKMSNSLVNFMKILKERFDKGEKESGKEYTVGIATSPRFENSEKKGFSHHGFYNYGALDTVANVDLIFGMGYDFNIGKIGAGLPDNKFDLISKYAKKHLKNDKKFVYSLPFYGRSFDKNGNYKGILSEKNNHSHFPKKDSFGHYINKGDTMEFNEGELCIKNGNRVIYAQSPGVHKWQLKRLDLLNMHNIAFWRLDGADPNSVNEIYTWKHRDPQDIVKEVYGEHKDDIFIKQMKENLKYRNQARNNPLISIKDFNKRKN